MATTFLPRDGGRISYDDTGGDGPLMVCLPGAGDLRANYRFLTPRLTAAGYRVVTMDLRGHGESSVDWDDYTPRATGEDILALLRHLDAGPAVVMGQSFSPAAAIWAAAEAPDLVAGVVLSAAWADEPVMSPLLKAMSQVVLRFPAAWARFYRSLYPTAPPADLRDYVAALRANLAEPGRLAAARTALFSPKSGCNSRIGELTCPVLVLMGTKDPDFKDPAAQAHTLAGRARDATVTMIEGAGHYPPAEFPEPTAEALLAFLARTREGGHRR